MKQRIVNASFGSLLSLRRRQPACADPLEQIGVPLVLQAPLPNPLLECVWHFSQWMLVLNEAAIAGEFPMGKPTSIVQ